MSSLAQTGSAESLCSSMQMGHGQNVCLKNLIFTRNNSQNLCKHFKIRNTGQNCSLHSLTPHFRYADLLFPLSPASTTASAHGMGRGLPQYEGAHVIRCSVESPTAMMSCLDHGIFRSGLFEGLFPRNSCLIPGEFCILPNAVLSCVLK